MEPVYTGGLLILGAVVWVVCAVYAYQGARKFGRRPAVWGALGIVFGPIALMVLYILPKQHDSGSGGSRVERLGVEPQDHAGRPLRGAQAQVGERPAAVRRPASAGGRRQARIEAVVSAWTGTGRAKLNVAPWPSSESTQIRPPWCSTISRQIGRPSPVPRGLSVRVSPAWPNCSKTFS